MPWYLWVAAVVIGVVVAWFLPSGEHMRDKELERQIESLLPTPKYYLTLDYVEGDRAYYTDIYGGSWSRRIEKGVDPPKVFVPKSQPLPNYARLRR